MYQKNLEALVQVNPVLAAQLFAISENKRFEVFQGKDPIDINLLDVELQTVMYGDPKEDIPALIDSKENYERYPYRYFFGIGNGVYLKTALKSVAIRQIIVIEPLTELLYIALNLLDFSEELANGTLILDIPSNLTKTKVQKYIRQSKIFARMFELEAMSPYYLNTQYETMVAVNTLLVDAIAQSVTGHGNSAIDALMGIEHHFANLPEMVEGPVFDNLLGKAQGETAIIVATGPSLTKQLPLLKKIQDHVCIISLDATLPILEKHGIKPDFVTVIERIALTSKFFERTSPEFQKEINFVCVSIIHQDVKDAIQEGNLYFQMRPHGYTQYFGLDRFGYIGIGMSTANLAHELAIVMGFKQGILIGQDLAFGDNDVSHADDHTFESTEIDPSKHEFFTTRYGGEGMVRTTEVWNMFRHFFEAIIDQTQGVFKTINATEGGSRIQGSIEMPFADAVAEYVNMDYDKQPIEPVYLTPEELEQATTQIIDKTNAILQKSVDMSEHVEALFMKVQEVTESLVEKLNNDALDTIDYDYLQTLSDEIDEVKAYTKEKWFITMFFDSVQASLVQMEMDLAEVIVAPVKSEEDRQIKLVDWVMKHRYWLFNFAGSIDAQLTVIKRAILGWPEAWRERIEFPLKKEIEVDEEKYQMLLQRAKDQEEEMKAKMAQTHQEAFESMKPKQ